MTNRELFLSSPLFLEIRRLLVALAVFAGSAFFACGLYSLTLPDGLPWGVEPRWANGWRWAALAAGLFASIVNRYLGWRVGLAAAIGWMFMPIVWDGAILGTQAIAVASIGMTGLWFLNAVFLWVTRKAREIWFADEEPKDATTEMCGSESRRMKVNDIVSWSLLGAAGIFAIASLWLHDYRLGEAASAYARGVVREADGRIIVLNGVCDEQVKREVEGKRSQAGQRKLSTISPVGDEACRTNLVAWARSQWPGETNLMMAAQVGIEPMLEVAVRAHPERFYLMNGGSSSHEAWERRWTEFAPYLKSSDKFVRIARRAFAYEGCSIANAMREKSSSGKLAWRMYMRICTEVDYGNIAALANMSEMIRRGHAVAEQDRKYVHERVNAFLANEYNRRHAGEIARAAGPVKADHELVARMSEWVNARMMAMRAAGENPMPTDAEKRLVEQSNAMIRAVDDGDWTTAGCLARKILSEPRWYGYIPANAVMGDISAMAGDYVASEAFYRMATSGTNETPAAVWNNYADTLMHLGKTEEAERILRKSISQTDGTFWFPRITLAEVLTQKARAALDQDEEGGAAFAAIKDEVRELVGSAIRHAPAKVIRRIREEQHEGTILGD